MARGLWRSWVDVNGADKWSARVELRHGEWADVEQAAYDAHGHQPPFWELPLKEDYMEARRIEPLDVQLNRIDLEIMPVVIVVLMIVGGVAATLAAIWFYFFNR
jgi:hypothetical protein